MWSPDRQDQEFFYQAKLQKYTAEEENESERSIYSQLDEDRFGDQDEDEEYIIDDGQLTFLSFESSHSTNLCVLHRRIVDNIVIIADIEGFSQNIIIFCSSLL